MIYNVSINTTKENTPYFQNIKIEAEYTEELFDKIKSVSFLLDGYIESITINQEVKKEYSRHKDKKEDV